MYPIDAAGPDGVSSKPHIFALRPVQLSTVGDQSMFLCGGVIVSNKCFNWPEGDPCRVSTGRNPAFEETVCWMLVTHTYYTDRGPLTYAAVGPPDKDNSPERNQYEHVFGWRRFLDANPGAKVSRFGFTDIKQTGKDTTRAILPKDEWPIAAVASRLASIRDKPTDLLAVLPMVTYLKTHNRETPRRRGELGLGGMDLRRMLLIEMLLKDTPLDALLRPTAAPRMALAVPRVPGGASGLYIRMKIFCDFVK